MDIPVSRLNQRMALRLPAQFPLGLVFVVGTVDSLNANSNGDSASGFFLAESNHRLRCQLSDRASRETDLKNGYRVRAGGHLAFDSQQADYYLIARDIEILPLERPRASSLGAIITDYNKRSEQAGLVPAELPDWVSRMAPPEIMIGVGSSTPSQPVAPASPPAAAASASESTKRTPPGTLGLGHDVAVAGLSEELIEFLSEAMDSDDDVELTAEMVAEYSSESGAPTGADSSTSVSSLGADQVVRSDDVDQSEIGGRKRKKRILWIAILILMILALSVAAVFILTEFVI